VRFGLSANSSSCVAQRILEVLCAASYRAKVLELVAPAHSRLIADGSRNWRISGPLPRGLSVLPLCRRGFGATGARVAVNVRRRADFSYRWRDPEIGDEGSNGAELVSRSSSAPGVPSAPRDRTTVVGDVRPEACSLL